MSFQARLTTQQQLSYCPHTSASGEALQMSRKGVATGGSATTLVDTDLTDVDDAWNGYWVHMLTGNSQGQWKRIGDWDQGTNTATLENNGFTQAIASGDVYELVKFSEPTVVVDSSAVGPPFTITDAQMNEADDAWNDYYIVPISGAQRGRIGLVTDFDNATGQFDIAAASGSVGFTAALSAGDVCVLRKFVEASNVSLSLSEEYIPRPGNRVNFSKGDGIVGPRGGTVSFTTRIRPSGSLSAADADAGSSEISGLFQAAGLVEVIDKSTTVSGGSSTTTTVDIATGKHENFTIGNGVIINGNFAVITAKEDNGASADTLTVTPTLPKLPLAGVTVSACRMYRKSLDGDPYGVTIEIEQDGVRYTLFGCKGNVTLTDAAAPELSWEFSVDHWVREQEAAPYNAVDAYDTASPVLAQERLAYLSDTKTDINGFTASPNSTVTRRTVQGSKGVNGGCGFQFTNLADAGGTWNELLDSSGSLDQDERWLARTSKDLIVVYGSNATTFACRIPTAYHIENPNPADSDGLQSVPCVYGAMDAGVQQEATNGGAGVADTTLSKVPDFAFIIT